MTFRKRLICVYQFYEAPGTRPVRVCTAPFGVIQTGLAQSRYYETLALDKGL